jgi:hypothetical protein
VINISDQRLSVSLDQHISNICDAISEYLPASTSVDIFENRNPSSDAVSSAILSITVRGSDPFGIRTDIRRSPDDITRVSTPMHLDGIRYANDYRSKNDKFYTRTIATAIRDIVSDIAVYPWFKLKDIHPDLINYCYTKVMTENDVAHRWKHLLDVMAFGCEIAEGLSLEKEPFIYAALIHDLFSESDRENHHEKGAEWAARYLDRFLPDELDSSFDRESFIYLVSGMCRTHRASYTGVYENVYEEAFSCADRGKLDVDGIYETILRGYNFYRHNNPILHESEIVEKLTHHFHEKYGTKGYAKYPDPYHQLFPEELKAFREFADNVDPSVLEDILVHKKVNI